MSEEMQVNTELKSTESGQDNPDIQQQPESTEKTFTQSELDKILADRLARERKKFNAELEQIINKERELAQLNEAEKQQVLAKEAIENANKIKQTLINKTLQAEAKSIAVSKGVKQDKIDYILKLADLSNAVDEGSDELINTAAIEQAISDVLKSIPEFLVQNEHANRAGSEIKQGNTGGAITLEKLEKMPIEDYIKSRGKSIR